MAVTDTGDKRSLTSLVPLLLVEPYIKREFDELCQMGEYTVPDLCLLHMMSLERDYLMKENMKNILLIQPLSNGGIDAQPIMHQEASLPLQQECFAQEDIPETGLLQPRVKLPFHYGNLQQHTAHSSVAVSSSNNKMIHTQAPHMKPCEASPTILALLNHAPQTQMVCHQKPQRIQSQLAQMIHDQAPQMIQGQGSQNIHNNAPQTICSQVFQTVHPQSLKTMSAQSTQMIHSQAPTNVKTPTLVSDNTTKQQITEKLSYTDENVIQQYPFLPYHQNYVTKQNPQQVPCQTTASQMTSILPPNMLMMGPSSKPASLFHVPLANGQFLGSAPALNTQNQRPVALLDQQQNKHITLHNSSLKHFPICNVFDAALCNVATNQSTKVDQQSTENTISKDQDGSNQQGINGNMGLSQLSTKTMTSVSQTLQMNTKTNINEPEKIISLFIPDNIPNKVNSLPQQQADQEESALQLGPESRTTKVKLNFLPVAVIDDNQMTPTNFSMKSKSNVVKNLLNEYPEMIKCLQSTGNINLFERHQNSEDILKAEMPGNATEQEKPNIPTESLCGQDFQLIKLQPDVDIKADYKFIQDVPPLIESYHITEIKPIIGYKEENLEPIKLQFMKDNLTTTLKSVAKTAATIMSNTAGSKCSSTEGQCSEIFSPCNLQDTDYDSIEDLSGKNTEIKEEAKRLPPTKNEFMPTPIMKIQSHLKSRSNRVSFVGPKKGSQEKRYMHVKVPKQSSMEPEFKTVLNDTEPQSESGDADNIIPKVLAEIVPQITVQEVDMISSRGRKRKVKLYINIFEDSDDDYDPKSKLKKTPGSDDKNYMPGLSDAEDYEHDVYEDNSDHHSDGNLDGAKRKKNCLVCKESFRDREEMTDHYAEFPEHKQYTCLYCNERFRNLILRSRHITEVHPEYEKTCHNCNKKFKTRTVLLNHLQHCGHKENVSCPHDGCSKMLAVCYLKAHMKDCHSGESTVCDICGKVLSRPRTLLVHRRRHTGEGFNFRCTHTGCDVKFDNSSNLRVHMYRHSDCKPLKCSLCDFRCRQQASILAHFTAHHKEEQVGYVRLSEEEMAAHDHILAEKKVQGTLPEVEGEERLSLNRSKATQKKSGKEESGQENVKKQGNATQEKFKKQGISEQENTRKQDNVKAKMTTKKGNKNVRNSMNTSGKIAMKIKGKHLGTQITHEFTRATNARKCRIQTTQPRRRGIIEMC